MLSWYGVCPLAALTENGLSFDIVDSSICGKSRTCVRASGVHFLQLNICLDNGYLGFYNHGQWGLLLIWENMS